MQNSLRIVILKNVNFNHQSLDSCSRKVIYTNFRNYSDMLDIIAWIRTEISYKTKTFSGLSFNRLINYGNIEALS